MRADWLRTVFLFNKYILCCSASSQVGADFEKEKKALKTTRIITVAFMSFLCNELRSPLAATLPVC